MGKTLSEIKRNETLVRISTKKYFQNNYDLYLFLLPAVIVVFIFHYLPIYGIIIAFKNFNPVDGILGSPWVGLDNFKRFVSAPQFVTIFSNTLSISLYDLVAGFPVPIILALLLNQVTKKWYKSLVQTITYAPHFISTVIMVSMITLFLNPKTGIINNIISVLGGTPIAFMDKPEWFSTIFVITNIWQGAGWAAIIYLASIAGVSPELHESAIVDGASKLRRIWHIDLPSIMPTIITMLTLRMGQILNVNFEKVLLMQNPLNTPASNIISTYVYNMGVVQARYDFATAVGLFNSLISLVLLVSVNQIVRKYSESSLW